MKFFYTLGYLVGRAKFQYALGARDGFAPTVNPNSPDSKKLALVRAALADAVRVDGSIVAAVKLHRELFNSSLKEAVDTVRAMKAEL